MSKNALQKGDIVGVLLPPTLTESFEIGLSRIVDLNRQGIRVKAIVCDGAVKGCVSNPLGYEAVCRHCIRVRDEALDYHLQEQVELLPMVSKQAEGCTALTTTEAAELEAGVNSTILTFYRCDAESSMSQPLRRWVFQKLACRYREHSSFVHAAMRELISKRYVDRLEFFNGRIVPTRGALLAAHQEDCNFGVIEVSGRDRHLTVAENNSVHDIVFKQDELRQFLERPSLDRRVGVAFFESRRKGEETNDKSFTSRQKLGQLQRRSRPLLVIFTSSADELKVSGSQWFTQASQDPVSFIVDLSKRIQQNFDIVVRMHPNQAGDKTGASKAMIKTLATIPYIDLIPPSSSVSSYELLDASQAVLTFGSTIGLEATYWGKPSILAGRALWDCLDIAYKADTAEEVQRLLTSNPRVRSRHDSLCVGAYYTIGAGITGSLTWRHKGLPGFSVDGRSYLGHKRNSSAYWLTRALDFFLKKF